MVPIENIVGITYQFRGQKVIPDRDLAELYNVETKVLKQAVRRNIFRFPEDFMFELTLDEVRHLRSQNVTLKQGQHSKYGAMAFAEQGVAMLSSVLKSEMAIQKRPTYHTERLEISADAFPFAYASMTALTASFIRSKFSMETVPILLTNRSVDTDLI
ncbi:MAG: ORF6N domain-containing protein [Pseudomonadota bacterium]